MHPFCWSHTIGFGLRGHHASAPHGSGRIASALIPMSAGRCRLRNIRMFK